MVKFRRFFFLNLGLLLVAIGIYYFLVPSNLAAGGVSGLAMVINKYIPSLPIGALMLGMNLILFIISYFAIGREFATKTVYSSLMLSGMIWMMEQLIPISKPMTDDLFIQLIFGILISGIGMAIVFNQNSSTGGTDIIAKIINKYFHLPIGKAILSIDFLITLFAAAAFGPKIGMYSLLGVVINGFVIDTVIEGLNISKNVVILTTEVTKIEAFIIDELERTSTVYYARGSYSKQDREVVSTIVNNKEFIRLRNYIKAVDPSAFITISHVHEVLGEGFKDIA